MDSPLLSPAKARQAAIQAKDWAYVNSWLTRQYAPNPVPPFERNHDTLRTLLSLAAANDSADEEASLVQQAREQALAACKARAPGPHEQQKDELLDELELCLDDHSQRNLDDWAETATELGALGTDPTELGRSIVELTAEEFAVNQQLAKVEALRGYLEEELERLRAQLETFRTDAAYEAPANLPSLTAEWTRGTKLLTAKVNEYQDRRAALERSKYKGPTLEDIVREEEETTRLAEAVRRLEARMQLFHDLPKDVRGARAKYRELEQELGSLAQQRDSMFEKLVNRDAN